MILSIKNYVKKNADPVYQKLRTILFSPYMYIRRVRLASFIKETVYPFSYKNISFSIILDPRNGFIDQEIYWKGVYEEEILDFYTKHIRSGDTFVDIGTNIGEHTLFNSRLVGEGGHIVSFEPIIRLFDQLTKSIRINDMQNVKAINAACGEHEQDMTIYLRDKNIGGSSLVPFMEKEGEKEVIHIITADSILKDFKQIDFIKIDTEGYEYETLLGLEQTLKRCSPSLLIEYSPIFYIHNATDKKHNGLKTVELLQKYHYTAYDLENGEKEIQNLVSWGESFTKDQTNIFCKKR